MAWSPFDEGWQRQHKNADNLQAYDKYCPSVEVHPGYFVKKIAVRTAANGIECQFPSGNNKDKKEDVVVVEPIVTPIEPVCKDERVCEWCWSDWYHHEHCSNYWMWGRYPKCKDVEVCEE